MTSADLATRLAVRLGGLWGEAVAVGEPRRLSAGASRETWSFEANRPGAEPVRLVLRRDPSGQPDPETIAREAALLPAALRHGVPVPELVDHGTHGEPVTDDGATGLGAPYLISRHIEGETIPRRLLRDDDYAHARAGLAAELGRVLARIHRIPVDRVPGLPAPDPLAWLTEHYDALDEPLPTVEIALRWLHRHRPGPAGDTLVHGDFRNGNLIVGPDGLRAVLDWELAHRGDPMEDLGWLCVKAWRFGAPEPVGGFGSRAQLLDGYAEVAGVRPDAGTLHWWEVYGTARWAVMCGMQARRHLSGQARSVELATVGRRVCEQEHDLLLALGIEPAEPDPVTAPEAPDLHGRPTASELLEAVRDYLGADGDYHARVAANALGMVQRELAVGAAQQQRHDRRLAELGVADSRALADALRRGDLDAGDESVLDVVRRDVADRLAVANPRYRDRP
ncbi:MULTISPECIES: phosphotransferase family protein [Prauserella salsuginis group]|uniref:Phosphotransferase family protein n=1 Tax=Prauserella salsuginis TaxID=387889 RepID=A0ABW6G3C9_9PSEU|nr:MULTISPECIES: phosphotransferase family protein [Prauserella salsuginis group]MCR3718585.1 putative kinase, aminoglycoside phosphotransferase (APT) family [Prauserella flava]MCR3733155.1 putative kinase, aminoglycoside phosphotransferase (APT) family [Prauserella salsuginis]